MWLLTNPEGALVDIVKHYLSEKGVPAAQQAEFLNKVRSYDVAGLEASPDIAELVHDALRSIGVLRHGETIRSFADNGGTVRGGAETFIADSCLETDAGPKRFILKHTITMGGAVQEKTRGMISQRGNMQQIGVEGPELYGYAPRLRTH